MNAESKKDFFISYNVADKVNAEWIAWTLEEAGYTVVMQLWDFGTGENFALKMQQAMTDSERTIAVLSPNYLSASYTHPEWAGAFAKDPTGEKSLLIPVRVRECELEGLLAQINYIDLVDLDEGKAKEKLLDEIEKKRRKPAEKPSFQRVTVRVVPQKPEFPGGLPSINNVPWQRNSNFTGREELLGNLEKALDSGEPAALTLAIAGLGGIGKTQLALEYSYRYAHKYGVIWWIRSENPETIAADCAALAKPLNLPQKDSADQELIHKAVRQWLEQNPDWLIVFDNVAEPNDIRKYLPHCETGHVVITSRYKSWSGVAKPVTVFKMDEGEAVAFISKRTGKTDENPARELAKELDYLPLALDQAGAYIEATSISISDYLDLYHKRRREILKKGTPSEDYDATVASTWEISFEKLKEESPAGEELLNLCAFLAPDDIPKSMIIDGKKHLPESLADAVIDTLMLNDALAALGRYSLVKIGEDSLSVHRLVQVVTRDRLSGDDKKKWSEAAVEIVNDVFPEKSEDVSTWDTCSRLLSHATVAAGFAENFTVAHDAAGRLLNLVGEYLRGRAEYEQAKSCQERSLEIYKEKYGESHNHVATALEALGDVLHILGDFEGARKNIERAIEIFSETSGENHPKVAFCLNSLGSVLHSLGDLEDARKSYERALEILQETSGENQDKTASTLNSLGTLLIDLGDFEGAKKNIERAIEIFRETSGENHPNLAAYCNNLANVLHSLDDFEGARKNSKRALDIYLEIYGEKHPFVAIALTNLGRILEDLGDLEGAKKNIERALEILTETLGENHPKVAFSLNGLGLVFHALGDLEAARKNIERALEILKETLGENHPLVATSLTHLGRILRDSGDLDGARINLERALEICQESLGDDNPKTKTIRENLENL